MPDTPASPSSPGFVWLDGTIVPLPQARISPLVPGFTTGVGVFETMVDRGRGPVALTRHWARLCNGCRVLGLSPPDVHVMSRALREVSQANGMVAARLRFTIASTGAAAQVCIAAAEPLSVWPDCEHVLVVPWTRNEHGALAGVKCCSYGENVMARREAARLGAGEAIFANTAGDLCEGAASNVFVIRAGEVLTPPLCSGCLPGVTRELVIETCRAHGVPVRECVISMSEFLLADEAFLTSSTRDVHPIASINGRALANAPGELTACARSAFEDLIKSATSVEEL